MLNSGATAEQENYSEEDEGHENKGPYAHLKPWQFKPGQSGNPSGRPKGAVSLKEYAKKMLHDMTDEEKLEFMKGLDKDIIWEMAEGKAQANTSLYGKDGEPIVVQVVKYADTPNPPQV